MKTEKILMSEVATLYYKKNMTQQEIAETLHLSRQTVSKLLSDAIEEKIVEIIIHDPQKDCKELEERIRAAFGIRDCVVCSVSGRNESVHRLIFQSSQYGYTPSGTLRGLLDNGGEYACGCGYNRRGIC